MVAEVILWGKRIGAVSDAKGYVEFNYDSDFIDFAKYNNIP